MNVTWRIRWMLAALTDSGQTREVLLRIQLHRTGKVFKETKDKRRYNKKADLLLFPPHSVRHKQFQNQSCYLQSIDFFHKWLRNVKTINYSSIRQYLNRHLSKKKNSLFNYALNIENNKTMSGSWPVSKEELKTKDLKSFFRFTKTITLEH